MIYELRYETRLGRCAWCWDALPDTESHTVASATRSPSMELRFHHSCWMVYRSVCGLEAERKREEWTPQKLEELRMAGGYSWDDLCRKLHARPERLRRYMSGDESALSSALKKGLYTLSRTVQFAGSMIDWSDDRAFFCLLRHLRWSVKDAEQKLKIGESTAKSWANHGVPYSRPNTWLRLSRLAAKHGFDAGMVVDDRQWTGELLDAAITASGKSVAIWSRLAGYSDVAIRNYRKGKDAITRQAAHGLTRAATVLGVQLPPVGRVNYARPPQERHLPKERQKRWTPEMVALLGTMSDSQVAALLKIRTPAVAKHRHRLGIPKYDPKEFSP